MISKRTVRDTDITKCAIGLDRCHFRGVPGYGALLLLYHKLVNHKCLAQKEIIDSLRGFGQKFLEMARNTQLGHIEAVMTSSGRYPADLDPPIEIMAVYESLVTLLRTSDIHYGALVMLISEESLASIFTCLHTPYKAVRVLILSTFDLIYQKYCVRAGEEVARHGGWGFGALGFFDKRDLAGMPPLVAWVRYLSETGAFATGAGVESPFRFYSMFLLPSLITIGGSFHLELILRFCGTDPRYVTATLTYYRQSIAMRPSETQTLMIRSLGDVLRVVINRHVLVKSHLALDLVEVDRLLVEILADRIVEDHVLVQRALAAFFSDVNFLYYVSKRSASLIPGLFDTIYRKAKATNQTKFDIYRVIYLKFFSDMVSIDRTAVSQSLMRYNRKHGDRNGIVSRAGRTGPPCKQKTGPVV